MEKLSFNHTVSNKSNYFVLVGNCKDYISHHTTLYKAQRALEEISIGDSKWAVIDILEPNETKTLNNLEKNFIQ